MSSSDKLVNVLTMNYQSLLKVLSQDKANGIGKMVKQYS